jgi:C4-dicarboxylate-specific signal transduction histidine kinase
MTIKEHIEIWKGNLEAHATVVVLVAMTASLTTIALLMTWNALAQKEHAKLVEAGLGFQAELTQTIEDDEDELPLVLFQLTQGVHGFEHTAKRVLAEHPHYSRLELRDDKGVLIQDQVSANATEQSPRHSRQQLPDDVASNFKKAVAEKKIHWAQSIAPSGERAFEVLVPSPTHAQAMVIRLNPNYWLAHLPTARLSGNMQVVLVDHADPALHNETNFATPLTLRGLNASLIFSYKNQKSVGFDPASLVIIALGLTLFVVLMSFNSEVFKARKTQELLAKQELAIAKSSQMSTLGEISTTLAHELNQPLSTITNYIATCEIRLKQLGYKDKILDKALQNARSQTLRAGEVVQSIRQFLKRGPAVRATIDYGETIGQLMPIIKAMVKEHNAIMEVSHEADLCARIDPSLFEQIVVNLCKNGLDAMEAMPSHQKKIKLLTRTFQDDNGTSWARVDVVDKGYGVKPEDAAKLFDSFFTTKKDGLGIGLNLCRSIAESYGGHIIWKNNDDAGATFSLELPKYITTPEVPTPTDT